MSVDSPPQENLRLLLRDLPYAQEESSDGCIAGLLVISEPGFVRLVVGRYCFTFDVADVLSLTRLDAQREIDCHLPTVRLTLKSPATLLRIEAWAEFRHTAAGALRPFALTTRPYPIVAPPRAEFRERELRFCRALE